METLLTPEPAPAPAVERHRGRGTAAMVLIVVGSLLAPFAVVGWFVRNEILITDRFVATVAPLADDDAIQAALVDRVSTEVVKLADRVQPGLVTREQVLEVAGGFVASPEFEQIWTTIMREAHPQLEQVLLGRDTDLLQTSNGQVVLNLVAVGLRVQEQLVAAGLTQAAELEITGELALPLFESQELATVQRVSDLIERLAPWVVAAALAAFVLAVAIAPRRSVALKWAGIGLLVGAFLVGSALLLGRLQYLAALERIVPKDAAAAAYTILLDPLIGWIRIWIGIALLLIIIGLATAPWRRGLAARPEQVTVGQWMAGHRANLVVIVVSVGFGVILLWHRPTLTVLLVTIGLVAATIIGALLVGSRAARELRT